MPGYAKLSTYIRVSNFQYPAKQLNITGDNYEGRNTASV